MLNSCAAVGGTVKTGPRAHNFTPLLRYPGISDSVLTQ
jgi:hypothetical protein